MKINASITILGDGKGVRIELRDDDAAIVFLEVKMTPEAFVGAAMGRLGHSSCECEVCDLDKVGKKMEWKKLEFKLSNNDYTHDRKVVAGEEALKHCPDGWTVMPYFGSQDSFFYKNGEQWARCNIRRWVSQFGIDKSLENNL